MDELFKRKVIEHNDLISSVAKMDKIPLKMFELAVSCIDTKNPPKDNTVYLSKKELFAFFSVEDSNKHSRFKQALETMQKQAYFRIKPNEKNNFEFESIVPIPYIKWNNYNDLVTVEFNRLIMPYLIEMAGNFTKYAISDLIELESKYSIILYKWLNMYYNQYEYYKEKNRSKDQLLELKNPKVSMKELRELTDTTDIYERFVNFENNVLKQAMSEINEFTHFNVSYEKVKIGKYIDSIQFYITKKKVPKEVNGEYKEREQDETYLKSKEEKEQLKQKYFAQAMASPYTRMLNETMLLFPHDLMDIETMANLQQFVYPIYDELKEKRGIEGVKTHMSYVSSKQDDYSKRNIAQYLKKSITSYLEAIKFKDELKK